MKVKRHLQAVLLISLLLPFSRAGAQEFKKWQPKLMEFKQWLDSVGGAGERLWLRLDSKSRPHRVYVGEDFDKADESLKERLIEVFSHHLAGHPEKFMLIDIFDARTGAQIGEFGWGGFKLFSNYLQALKQLKEPKENKIGPPLSDSPSLVSDNLPRTSR
ncbi:MAG: hypothetical protein HY695_11360 [Deltaproteobacteria bacterium]|nr:hypothetical protein [Deltaproteobacteria bacterium]